MTDNNTELIKEMIDIFTVQVDEYTQDMQKYYTNKNWQALSRLAHKAKSSVAIMGMTELAEMLKNFELLARDHKDVDKYPQYINRFAAECKAACKELTGIYHK